MKRSTIAMLFIAISVGATSQVFGAPAFVEANVPEGKAIVYFYCPQGLFAVFSPLVVAKDGPIGTLPAGNYRAYISDPGTARFWLVSLNSAGLKFEAVAGQVYYVKCGELSISPGYIQPTFELTPREKAVADIGRCALLSD
jgi:hypothetical protein